MRLKTFGVSLAVSVMLAVMTTALAAETQQAEEEAQGGPGVLPAAGNSTAGAQVQAALSTLPLYFIENRGQLDERVAYYLQGRDTAVYFTAAGVTFAFVGSTADRGTESDARHPSVRPAAWGSGSDGDGAPQRWAVRLEFVGANPEVRLTGQEPTPARVSYFTGPRPSGRPGCRPTRAWSTATSGPGSTSSTAARPAG